MTNLADKAQANMNTLLTMLDQFEAELPDHVNRAELASVYLTRAMNIAVQVHGREVALKWIGLAARQHP